QSDDLSVALLELGLKPRHVAELGGAHGRKIFRVGKENCPAVANPFVEADWAFGAFGSEIRSCVIDSWNLVYRWSHGCGAHVCSPQKICHQQSSGIHSRGGSSSRVSNKTNRAHPIGAGWVLRTRVALPTHRRLTTTAQERPHGAEAHTIGRIRGG